VRGQLHPSDRMYRGRLFFLPHILPRSPQVPHVAAPSSMQALKLNLMKERAMKLSLVRDTPYNLGQDVD